MTARTGVDPRERVSASVWCALAGLVLVMFSGYSRYLHLPISLDRFLFPLAVLLVLTSAAVRRIDVRPIHVLMGCLGAWAVISMVVWHNTDAEAGFALLDRMLIPFVLFTVASAIFSTTRRRDLLLITVSAIGVYLGVTALLELAAPSLVVPSYIVDLRRGAEITRAGGPFRLPDAMGTASLLCALGGVGLALRRQGWTALGVAGFAGGMIGAVLCLSRGVWLATGVTLALALVLLPTLRRLLPLVAAAGVAGAAFLVAAVPGIVDSIVGRSGAAGPVHDRLASNEAAFRLLTELPLTGIGWQRFYPHGAEWVRQSDAYPMNVVTIELHNVVLARAAELGIPAALVFVAILGLVLREGLRPARGEELIWRRLAVLALVAWVISGMFAPMTIPFPNYLMWLLAGVGTGTLLRRAAGEPPPATDDAFTPLTPDGGRARVAP